jgi:hypothetical protein
MTYKFISVNNTKLKKFDGASFDIPAKKTCPGAGDCAKVCYAAKLSRIYPSYALKVERNHVATKRADFVEVISEEISDFHEKGGKYFRIHSGGDFYNQEYLDKWVEVMKRFPKLKFYAYTKSLKLEFPKLKNFTLIKSRGGKWDELIEPTDRQSLIIDKGSKAPRGYKIDNEDDLWWKKRKKIAFEKH